MTDPEGRYLFLRGKLYEMECTLANIYCPNKNPTNYLRQVIGKLMDFKSGSVIMTGDLNFCLEPRIDSTLRAQGTRNVQLKTIKKKLFQCQLLAIWRMRHPKTQDYTFYSPVHVTYSRIDYIMVKHSFLDLVAKTDIEITTLSDHSPGDHGNEDTKDN